VALLVVPLDAGETEHLTLAEWDLLRECERVLFEDPEHPLIERLRNEGITAGPFDDEPNAQAEGWALVSRPRSSRVAALAEAGARITSGVAPAPDALTAARGAYVGRRASAALGGLALIMARLRGPAGCPWDAEQTHESLRIHLQEEAHEVLEAIDAGHLGAELEEELGDLMLQVVFHAQMAADDERFDLAEVAEVISAKLIRRHPHVFGDVEVSGAEEVIGNWEEIKQQEKQRGEPFEGIPKSLPALQAAYKTQKRAHGLGFRAPLEDARAGLRAALEREPDEGSLGELLFWAVAVARASHIDPEGALRGTLLRFKEGLREPNI
jgi:XTP/dITP diphosphohydrolase